MTFRSRAPKASVCAALSLTVIAGVANTASAQTYLIDISGNIDGVVIEQTKPDYPSGAVPRGQEGWVRMHFVIAADGTAVDPIIIDSSGGAGFQAEAIKAAGTWRFESPESGAELPNNLVNIRTRIRRGVDGAGTDFIRQYRKVMQQVVGEQVETARTMVDAVYERGGWNLYESTLLWLLIGRIESAERDMADKLETYRRALSISTRLSLGDKDRLGLLGRIFALQDEAGHYADAIRTYSRLRKMDENSELVAELAPRAAEIEALVQSAETLTASATIYNPCDCDDGQPLWYYRPARRTFSFANPDGNVERFEARCETHRIRDDIEAGKSWTLAPEWGNCRVFVFGDDGTSFDFVEYPFDSDEQSAEDAAVARNHVLDRRN